MIDRPLAAPPAMSDASEALKPNLGGMTTNADGGDCTAIDH
jgi:hypothetical protein